jgi:hypothetical protein
MKTEFIDYTEALALKELGFDEPCFGFYDDISKDFYQSYTHTLSNNNIKNITKAPLYQQTFRWFREKHWLYPSVISHDVDNHIFTITGEKLYESDDEQDNFDTYEEAELECLVKLIEIVGQHNAEMTAHGVYK